MAGDQQPIIIKKKKGGHHAGHHGGAWKVAYADFVTAMMAFFLVMWLMGSDEETKAAISHYFNHPNTPYKQGRDPNSNEVHPLGEKEGSGESILSGIGGLWPEDLIERPKPVRDVMKENLTVSRLIEKLFKGKVYGLDVTARYVKFSLPDQVLFAPGSVDLTEDSFQALSMLGKVFKGFDGFITIEGHTDDTPIKNGRYSTNWELSFGRALTVYKYLVQNHEIDETRLTPVGGGPRRAYASNKDPQGREKNRRVEFTLSYDRLQ